MRQWLLPKITKLSSTTATRGLSTRRFNFNPEVSFDDKPDEHILNLPRVTADDLEAEKELPKGVKMLTRDFIENSLYNPHYGYFSKQAIIFSGTDSNSGFDFRNVRDGRHFQELVAERYAEYNEKSRSSGPGSQVWHTPTELFQPWYGQAVARCIAAEYLLKYFPYEDLIIYEIGAGNGTLAKNVLDFLQVEHPEVYERTRYNIIEISESLSVHQRRLLEPHSPGVAQVYQKSIFKWDQTEAAPCFFLAMEVVDNFAHDAIAYELESLRPYQTLVAVDRVGEFSTVYEPINDSLIEAYINTRQSLNQSPPLPFYLRSNLFRTLYRSIPLSPNLSLPEYIPTRFLSLLSVLRDRFPRHKLLLSDFSHLPEAIPGYNAPVVQARIRGQVVPITTLLVRPGYFDIFFPTNFELIRDMYELVMSGTWNVATPTVIERPVPRASPLTQTVSSMEIGSRFFFSRGRRMPVDGVLSGSGLPVGARKSNVFTHSEFLETYGEPERTELRNRENPMLDYYKNVKVLF